MAVNAVLGYLVEPRLMGAQLGLSPLVVFASLLIWGWVLGPVGTILAVPLTAAINYLAYPNDTEDYYYFTLTSAKTVDIVVSNFVPTGGDLLLYNEAHGLIDYVGYAAPTMRLDDQALSAGKYYVRVRATAGLSTSKLYTLRVTY